LLLVDVNSSAPVRYGDRVQQLPPVLSTRIDTRSPSYLANREAMQALLDEVNAQQQSGVTAGGERYIARHRERGKMLVRERMELLVDPHTPLLELQALAGYGTDYSTVGAGTVNAIGLIHGVECLLNGTDMTIRGGSSNPATVKKTLRGMEIAKQNRLPYISLTESAGADLPRQ
jgi:acyl-CoA carboxylase subunit beta